MQKTEKQKAPNLIVTRILAVLLLLQSGLFLGLGWQYYILNSNARIRPFWNYTQNQPEITWQNFSAYLNGVIDFAVESHLVSASLESVALFLLAILIFIAAIGFFKLWRFAWDMAIFVQGVTLALAVALYFTSRPGHLYILMLVSLIMVAYLSYAHVRVLFLPEDRRYLKEEEAR